MGKYLVPEKRERIEYLIENTYMTNKDIAKEVGCSDGTVGRIRNELGYANSPDDIDIVFTPELWSGWLEMQKMFVR